MPMPVRAPFLPWGWRGMRGKGRGRKEAGGRNFALPGNILRLALIDHIPQFLPGQLACWLCWEGVGRPPNRPLHHGLNRAEPPGRGFLSTFLRSPVGNGKSGVPPLFWIAAIDILREVGDAGRLKCLHQCGSFFPYGMQQRSTVAEGTW